MGVNADGKISLSVGIDEGQIKQSASQVKSILKKEISTINIDKFFDDKQIQQTVQKTVDSINKTLSKSKFKKADFSSLIPKVDSIMSNTTIPEKQRSNIVSGFGHQFEVLDKYANKDIIPLLSNSKVFEDYLNDLTNIVDFVKSIKGLSTKEQDRMIKDLSKADASDVETAFTLKDVEKKYGANIKYKIKPKDIVPLLQKSIENMDVTDEGQLKDFLGFYNRGKYLAQMDTSKSGVFRTFFEQFQKQHHQELEAFRTQYSDLSAKMEREVIGMSKDFDTLYNTKYKNKSLDTTDLVKGLKTNKTASQIHNAQAEKAPTTPQELTDTVLSVQSDVKGIDEKVEKAEKLANEAKEAANEVKKEINNTNKNVNKKKSNTTNIEKKDLKDSKQKNEQQSSPTLEQTKEEIDNAIETEEDILKRLQEESDLLQTEKELTESTKAKLEKRNETINKVIKNNFKDESKKSNYENLKNQHDNYANKKKANDNAWKELDSFEQYSPEWRIQLVKAQQAKEEEEKAWIKYYKAFDIAKNGKNQVAKSRLDKFNPQNEGLTEFDNKTYEIYIESLKAAMVRNQKGIDECEEDLKEYHEKKDELDKKINELNKNNNIVNDDVSSNKTPTPSNKLKSNNQTKPNIPVDLQQELESAFGFDFSNDIDSTAQAEDNLRKKTDNANKSLEDQNTITDNIAKNADSLMYYMGQINGDKTVLSNIFGTELQNQNNIGTGLLTSKSSKEYSNSVLSNENLDEYYAIDTSELKIYEAHAEEIAKEFYDFIHHLEQFCISMGTAFEGFDDNLENVNEESLYATAQKLFPDLDTYFNDFDEFYEYINEMIDLVSKSGINADGTINKINMHLFQKENGTDDIKTRFLKEMGYQGVNLSGTKYGNNVIFNPLDNIKVVASGKNIEEVVEQAINKVSSKQGKNVGETKSQTPQSKPQTGGTTNIKEVIEEQEELEEKTKKATNALKDQQQTLVQSNVKPSSQNPPEESTKEDDTEKNKSKSKPSVRIKKPIKSINKDEVKSDLNEVAQGEADSAHEASNEVKGFNLIAGSAEEAAEAKRKFVEANKDVLQSIVASMPKIEQEAEALEKVEDIKEESKNNAEIKNNNKENEDTIKQQKNLLDQQQPSLQQIEEAQLKEQQKIQQKVQEQLREEVYDDYSKPQRPKYDFEPDYDDIEKQAKEARQYYEDQISNDFEVKVETQLDLKQDETGQLSLFDNVLPEENWGQEVETKTNNISEAAIKGQISFQQLQEAIENSERAFAKLSSSKNTSGKSFLQNTDISNDVLEKYENISTTLGKGYKATGNLQELKNLSDELTDVKTKLKASFDETGNLKSTVDPFEVQNLLSKYDELINKIQNLKAVISSPTSEENIALKIAKDAKKAQQELDKLKSSIDSKFDKGIYNNVDRNVQGIIDKYGFKDDKGNLISSISLTDENIIFQQQMIEALKSSLDQFKKKRDELKQLKDNPLIDIDQLKQSSQEVEKLKIEIEQLEKDIKSAGDKIAPVSGVNKLSSQIEQFMIKNPRITGEARAQLQAYMDTLNSGASISVQNLGKMQQGFSKVFNEQFRAGNLGNNIWTQMLGKMREGVAFLATKFSFYKIFNQFRQGVQIVHEFDDALTEMMKVSDETRTSLEAYQRTTFDTAEAIGTNAAQIQNSTADFMRLGESLTEAAESARTASVLMNVSEFQSIDEATTSLIAMGAAYDDLSKMQIVDKLNEVGNNYSISTSGAAEALQMSASALKTAGNDMDEALALVTAGNQVVQDISKAGNGLRTIALRLTGKQMCPNIE